mgnify:CR=1 FL=1
MSRIFICPACQSIESGAKTRIQLEHTCGKDYHAAINIKVGDMCEGLRFKPDCEICYDWGFYRAFDVGIIIGELKFCTCVKGVKCHIENKEVNIAYEKVFGNPPPINKITNTWQKHNTKKQS